MSKPRQLVLDQLLKAALPPEQREALLRAVHVPEVLAAESGDMASRAVIAQALNLLLFKDLLSRVPTGRRYVEECVMKGHQVVFDHGALRTVALQGMGDLPAGQQAISRVLEPLGYHVTGLYPLDRLGMTGRAYTQQDFPEALPQFFVSELHPERFSVPFQAAARRVTASSRNPLSRLHLLSLEKLQVQRSLPLEEARLLLPVLLFCFGRHHAAPLLSDYELLLKESAEMAWIATEGNAFNHATDRVANLQLLVDEQRKRARPLKDKIEVSASGRVQQTALRADPVERKFIDANGTTVMRTVPGSFYEFIQRGTMRDEKTGQERLDLAFDSSNAQGIFKMTAAA